MVKVSLDLHHLLNSTNLKLFLEKNNLGSWYGWEIEHIGQVESEETIKAAYDFYESCKKGAVRAITKTKNKQKKHHSSMEILDNTLEEFVELFQGSTTYFGASKPLGQTRVVMVSKNLNIGLNLNL